MVVKAMRAASILQGLPAWCSPLGAGVRFSGLLERHKRGSVSTDQSMPWVLTGVQGECGPPEAPYRAAGPY